MMKKTTLLQLPKRGAMKELAGSQRTIHDYAKVTPIKPLLASPGLINNLRKP